MAQNCGPRQTPVTGVGEKKLEVRATEIGRICGGMVLEMSRRLREVTPKSALSSLENLSEY